jgi:hypothetical protein
MVISNWLAAPLNRRDGRVANDDPVGSELVAAESKQIERRSTVAREESVEGLCRGIPGRPRVAEQNAASAASEDQSRAQSGGPSADDHDVVHQCPAVQAPGQSQLVALGFVVSRLSRTINGWTSAISISSYLKN